MREFFVGYTKNLVTAQFQQTLQTPVAKRARGSTSLGRTRGRPVREAQSAVAKAARRRCSGVRSQRGAGGGKGMGPGAGGEWLRPRRRWCSGRRGRRRWQRGRRRGSWRRRRGEGGGREAGGWAPPHTLVVSVGSLGVHWGKERGAVEAATAAVGAAAARAVAAVGMVAAEGGGGDPSLNNNPPQPLPTITTTMVVTLQQGWRFGLGEPACPAGPPPRGLRRVFDDPPRGDPPPAWAHARAEIAVGMGWAGAGLSQAEREGYGWLRATGAATRASQRVRAGQAGWAGRVAGARGLGSTMGRSWTSSWCGGWHAKRKSEDLGV